MLEPRNGATQPWNCVIWPTPDGSDPSAFMGVGPFVWDATTALRIPEVSRATALYTGLIKQAAMDAYRGAQPLPRPRLLDAPDPTQPRSWFVGVMVEDYLWHGNALGLVTARSDETGWPLAVTWIPASWCQIVWTPGDPRHRYYVGERELPFDDVVHVRRGADRRLPARGVGVIEQHLSTFDRAALEGEYERSSLSGSGVPSVAIITPNPNLSTEEADDAKSDWLDKFAGPNREPAILPYGTVITPLGWSPANSQMVEARKMTLQDVANCFNVDGYWLGAPTSSLTYRSPGPMYLTLLRTSLEPVLVDFELAWGQSWLPRGQSIQFDRLQLTRDDFLTSLTALTLATAAEGPVMTVDEARLYLGLAISGTSLPAPTVTSPVDTVPAEEVAAA